MTAPLHAAGVTRLFDGTMALDNVDLDVRAGRVHALIGPNGAGKTTFLRCATGLVVPDRGVMRVMGVDTRGSDLHVRRQIGFVPSGDRSFYLRISGRENLTFFGRLHGLSRREAARQADRAMAEVGLSDARTLRVGLYSHGMQKRLSMARSLMVQAPLLLVDEATHDLDPDAASQVRELVRATAAAGAAVLWTTQRLEELRGFADEVTVLSHGRALFHGTVPDLMARARTRGYLLRLAEAHPDDVHQWATGIVEDAQLEAAPDLGSGQVRLELAADARLGDVIARLERLGARVESCTEARSPIEEAFLDLTRAAKGPVGPP